ncbi:MAG: hypothetical protein JO247_18625, partial [Chloroflexi bacterium]|nr:hypothetical protein [Chloroflexota bacterium]
MNATVLRTGLAAIVLATQTQLQTLLGWGPERVAVVDPAKLSFHPHGDAYLCLWVDLESYDRPILAGAGRGDTRATERLLVACRSRYAVDTATDATAWLTDGTLGHLALRLQVLNALVGWTPTDTGDDSGNALTVQPLVPASGARPRLEPDEKEWGESILGFDATYEL